MYHSIIRRKLLLVFDELNKGNYQAILDGMAPEFEHYFSGQHALGGHRRSLDAYRRWFERLARIFPRLKFDIRNIAVSGGPWNTLAAVEWVDAIGTEDGGWHQNSGVHIIRLRWGKVTEIRIYCDTQKVAELCEIQARCGLQEALAKPLS